MNNGRFYVYTLADPRNGEVFYVGKGTAGRMHQHVAECRRGVVSNAEKFKRIAAILKAGEIVIATKVEAGLTESEALSKERRLIGKYGFRRLTNVLPGEFTAMEKSKVAAQVSLSRLKPHDQWLAESPRTAFEIDLANRVRSELEFIAAHGQVSEAIITRDGVEFR